MCEIWYHTDNIVPDNISFSIYNNLCVNVIRILIICNLSLASYQIECIYVHMPAHCVPIGMDRYTFSKASLKCVQDMGYRLKTEIESN